MKYQLKLVSTRTLFRLCQCQICKYNTQIARQVATKLFHETMTEKLLGSGRVEETEFV
jgi:hypothetical protein